MSQLPQEGLVRLRQLLGDPKAGILPIIPVKKSAWWDGVRSGRFPQPVKIGRLAAWRAADIRELIARGNLK